MKLALATVCIIAFAVTGCGSNGGGAETVRVEGTEYAYVMPDTIEGGVVTMEFANTGKEPHEFAFSRLKQGETPDDFRAELENIDKKEPTGGVDVAGVPLLSPGEELTITRRLQPGTYVFACFVPAPDGKTHFDHGMFRSFQIQGDSGAELPDADGTIVARDDRYDVPELEAGTRTIELRNAASGQREFNLVRLNPGKTIEEAQKWFEAGQKGPAPLVFLGAIQSIPPQSSVFLTVDLDTEGQFVVFEGEHNYRATLDVTSG
jgi:uncharacterized cupredoxin-like copper-binding protein